MWINPLTSILDLTKLIALLSSKVRVVLPARLQYRFLHELQIEAMKRENSYLARVNKALFSKRRIPLADRESEALQWEKRKAVRTTISDTKGASLKSWGPTAMEFQQRECGPRRNKIII